MRKRRFLSFCNTGTALKDLGGNNTSNASDRSGGFMDCCVYSQLSLAHDVKKEGRELNRNERDFLPT